MTTGTISLQLHARPRNPSSRRQRSINRSAPIFGRLDRLSRLKSMQMINSILTKSDDSIDELHSHSAVFAIY